MYEPPSGDSVSLVFDAEFVQQQGDQVDLQIGGAGAVVLGVHSPLHSHVTNNVVMVVPPVLNVASTSHAHTVGVVSAGPPPVLAVAADILPHVVDHIQLQHKIELGVASALHTHRANKHFYRFEFGAQQQPSPFVTEGWWLNLSWGRLEAILRGLDSFDPGSLSLANESQGVRLIGFDSLTTQNAYVAYVRAYHFMDLSRFSPVEYPIQLEFIAENESGLFIHQNVLVHTADQCNIGLQIPLITYDSAHQVASQLATVIHTSPVAGHAALQAHGADQVTIRHEITLTAINAAQQAQIAQNLDLTHRSPANAASSTHSHTAEGLQITHTSPLSAHLSLHEVDDDLSAIINRSVLVAAGSNHDHYSEHFDLTHFSPLAISDPWHYHRVQRLSFLPEGWVFRALLDIGEADRVIVLDSDNRTAEIPAPESRELEVPAENRVLDVPPEVRELVLEPQGRVSSIGG